eukprot:2124453-Amphidinium_carterae.1
MVDRRGLFAPAAPVSPTMKDEGASSAGAGQKARRTKLMPWDAASAQMFQPFGVSALDSATPQEAWAGCVKGNKVVAFHSYLAAPDQWHVGAGLSQTAQTLLHSIEALESEDLQAVLVPDILKRALAEAETLKPHLTVLNIGKGSSVETKQESGSFRSLKKRTQSAAPPKLPSDADTTAAAEALYNWAKQDQSALRGLLSILSSGSTFYASYSAEKILRGYVSDKTTAESLVAAALARKNTGNVLPTVDLEETSKKDKDSEGLLLKKPRTADNS